MNTRNILTLIAFGSLTALVACSSDDEVDKFASTDAFCDARADAYCTGLRARCGSSQEACKATQVTKCKSDAAAASGQGRSYRSGSAQACIDSINSTYTATGSAPTPSAEAVTTAVCERVFSGAKQEADQCAQTYECQGALICDKSVCITESKVSGKAQCNNAGQTCETGRYCAQQGETKFCIEKGALDATCDANTAPCNETLRCVTGRCVARVTVGNPCNSDGDCGVDASFCDPTGKTCKPKYESSSSACRELR
jgi:hypothetical protein